MFERPMQVRCLFTTPESVSNISDQPVLTVTLGHGIQEDKIIGIEKLKEKIYYKHKGWPNTR